jgi:hypothetical protein
VGCEAEGVVCAGCLLGGRLVEGWVEGGVGGVVEVVVVVAAFVVVFVVVTAVLCAADVVDVDFYLIMLPIPFVSPFLSIRRIVSEIGKRHPIQFDGLEPLQPLPAGSILLLDSLQEGLEYEGSAAEEDVVVLEEYFEGFAGYLAVEEQVFVMRDEQDRSSAGLEVFQVAPLDAQRALAPVILEFEGVVIYLPHSQRSIESMLNLEVCR